MIFSLVWNAKLIIRLLLFDSGTNDNKTDEERLLELVDKRASKFINRALPDLPRAPPDAGQQTTPDDGGNGGAEGFDNLYEPLASAETTCRPAGAGGGEMYEDIDAVCDAASVAASGRATTSTDSGGSQKSARSRASKNSTGSKPVVVEEYLEPVLSAGERVAGATNWRPAPAPRTSVPPPPATGPDATRLQATYVNFENEKINATLEISLKLADCFAEMDRITRETLKCITDRKYASSLTYMHAGLLNVTWSEFDMDDDSQPLFVQNQVSYYRGRHLTLAPSGCVLVVSVTVM